VTTYQETVLAAMPTVEDGLAAFLRAQERAELLDSSVPAPSRPWTSSPGSIRGEPSTSTAWR